jgi:hypothetical protein
MLGVRRRGPVWLGGRRDQCRRNSRGATMMQGASRFVAMWVGHWKVSVSAVRRHRLSAVVSISSPTTVG